MQVFTAASAFALTAALVQATPLNIYNQCGESIELYDNSATETIASGASTTRTLSSGFNGMFRNGVSSQATLAEFSITGGYTWYDISIIPTGSTGPGSCSSLENCEEVTGGTGFNTPMQIAPDGCTTVTCLENGCADAYQYPSDDDKTHSCTDTATINLTFCPGGSVSTTTTTASTPATAAPTAAPQTAAPTAAPQTAAATTAPKTATPTTAAPQTAAPTTTSPPTSTPVPETEAPTTEVPTTTEALAATTEPPVSTSSPSLNSSAESFSSSSSSSLDAVVTKDATIVVSPNAESTSSPSTTSAPTSSSGSSQHITTETADSGSSLSTVVVCAVGALVAVGAIAAVIIARRKKQQLEAMEPKDSVYEYSAVLTPRSDIGVLNA